MNRVTSLLIKSAALVLLAPTMAFAEDSVATGSYLLPIGAGIAFGLAALGGTLGQSKAVSAALEAIGRNPTASGNLFTPMILGLVLIESLVILGLVVAFAILGKI